MAEPCFQERTPAASDGQDSGDWESIPAEDRSPFIHRFQTQRQKYVYDVNTRRIIRVSPAVWDIVEDFGCLKEPQMFAKYSSMHHADEIAEALAGIALARQRDGLFLSCRPKEVVPLSGEKVRERLEQRKLVTQTKQEAITEEDEQWFKEHIDEFFNKDKGA